MFPYCGPQFRGRNACVDAAHNYTPVAHSLSYLIFKRHLGLRLSHCLPPYAMNYLTPPLITYYRSEYRSIRDRTVGHVDELRRRARRWRTGCLTAESGPATACIRVAVTRPRLTRSRSCRYCPREQRERYFDARL